MSDYGDCIFDFGARIFESDEMFRRVKSASALYPNVVLILPSPDKEESLNILAERDQNPPQDLSFDVNRYFLSHHTYYALAKITIYTRGRTLQESSKEIIERIQR